MVDLFGYMITNFNIINLSLSFITAFLSIYIVNYFMYLPLENFKILIMSLLSIIAPFLTNPYIPEFSIYSSFVVWAFLGFSMVDDYIENKLKIIIISYVLYFIVFNFFVSETITPIIFSIF